MFDLDRMHAPGIHALSQMENVALLQDTIAKKVINNQFFGHKEQKQSGARGGGGVSRLHEHEASISISRITKQKITFSRPWNYKRIQTFLTP